MLGKQKEQHPIIIEELKKDIYLDDLRTGGEKESEVHTVKSTIIPKFKNSKFNLHKWNSNIKALEKTLNENTLKSLKQIYAKEQLRVQKKIKKK